MARAPRRFGSHQGIALLTVLLLTALLFIMVSAMLHSAGKEILIAGLHRDAALAEESAQAGLEDALRRMEGGRAWKRDALPSDDRCAHADGTLGAHMGLRATDTCVVVVARVSGPSGAVLEIRSDGAAGRARRRLGAVVEARTLSALPETIVLYSLVEPPGMEIAGGAVHARTFAQYRSDAAGARTTYAGWRIAQQGAGTPGGTGSSAPCYTHDECTAAGRPHWWPGHRWAVYEGRPLRPDPLPGNPAPDPRVPGLVLNYSCPAGAPPVQAMQTIGASGPGYQAGDLRADRHPADPVQSLIAGEPLYGCTSDGLPYTWVREAFDIADDPDADPDGAMWFAAIRLDHWRGRYACFDGRPLAWIACNGFHPDPALGDPSLGAVLPAVPDDHWAENHDYQVTGDRILMAADLALGRCADPPLCAAPANVRPTVVLARGDYTLDCSGSCPDGLGVLVVGGNLTIAGSFTYRGILVVRGTMAVAAGGVLTVHGGLSARAVGGPGVLRLDPRLRVAAGVAGPAAVVRKAWWER